MTLDEIPAPGELEGCTCGDVDESDPLAGPGPFPCQVCMDWARGEGQARARDWDDEVEGGS